jgi:hypothetical protein
VVAIAKLQSVRTVYSDTDPDVNLYTLVTRDVLRGDIGSTFRVWEENSSGRAAFRWTKGTDYLLFLKYFERARAWVIDGCGNSGPVSRSAAVLSAIRSMQTKTPDGLVQGVVSTDSWTTGVPGVAVEAAGNGLTFRAKTDRNGRFEFRLPTGTYTLKAVRQDRVFKTLFYSYENPEKLNITPGYCAQIQFSNDGR